MVFCRAVRFTIYSAELPKMYIINSEILRQEQHVGGDFGEVFRIISIKGNFHWLCGYEEIRYKTTSFVIVYFTVVM
jgi:hypothetical protein